MFAITVFCVLVAMASARNCHEHRDEIEQGPPLLGAWKPSCEDNGSYKPVQCREAVCMCYTADGSAIEGFEVSIGQAADMNCKCAREQHDYMESGLIGKMFYCEGNGNYSPVQCAGSVCFCGDENGQALESGQGGVHISEKDSLQC